MTFRVLGPARAGPIRPRSVGTFAGTDRLRRAERGGARAHHRTGAAADRRPHRARRPALPDGRRRVRRAGRRRPTPDGTLSNGNEKAHAENDARQAGATKSRAGGEERGEEEGGDQGDGAPRPRASRADVEDVRGRRRRLAAARSSSSSRRPRRRRSASTSAAATACARRSATSWICRRRSSASTSRTASSRSSCRFPARKRRSPS